MRRYRAEDLPGRKGIGRNGIKAFTDARGLIFVPPPETEWHAVTREVKLFSNSRALFNKMNEMYRLGVPVSEGFHYDAQLRGGKCLDNITLTCCEFGQKDTSGWPYANISPNDFVRRG